MNPPPYTEKSFLLGKTRPPSSAGERAPPDERSIAYPVLPAAYTGIWENSPSGLRRRRAPERTGVVIECCSIVGVFWFLMFSGLFYTALVWKPWKPVGPPPYVWKVAVVGAGPAGASAAYSIRKLAREGNVEVDITVYERADYIGGRATCRIAYDGAEDDDYYNIQIAARGFRTSNRILVDTASELNLKPVMLDGTQETDLSGSSGEHWGVFDGETIVYRQQHPTNFLTAWWWSLKLYYFYGSSPSITQSTITATLSKLHRIYSPRFFPFTSLTSTIHDLELTTELSQSGAQLLTDNGVTPAFQKDLVTAWTRRDFGNNLGTLHALAAMSAPDDGGDMTVSGGHWTLFEHMVSSSSADTLLSTSMYGMRKMDWGGWVLAAQPSDDKDDDPENGIYKEFDSVVVAAPWQFADIDIKGEPLPYVPDQQPEYVPLHVTLFKSSWKLAPEYFGYKGEVPETVLTTLGGEEFERLSGRSGSEGVGRVGFYEVRSVKRLARVDAMGVVVEEFLYKVVSPGRFEEESILKMLGAEGQNGVISWITRHEWTNAFPNIYPRTKFSEIKLDENVWYTGAIEELSSSMELSSLMGANVARLIVDGWKEEGRGKRPERNFQEATKKGEKTLFPETPESYLRAVYEGIWTDNLDDLEGEVEEVEEK